jgi:hypothetical protein
LTAQTVVFGASAELRDPSVSVFLWFVLTHAARLRFRDQRELNSQFLQRMQVSASADEAAK